MSRLIDVLSLLNVGQLLQDVLLKLSRKLSRFIYWIVFLILSLGMLYVVATSIEKVRAGFQQSERNCSCNFKKPSIFKNIFFLR